MKLIAYAVRDDELSFAHKFAAQYKHELHIVRELFGPENAHLAKGFDVVSTLGTDACNREALSIIAGFGIKLLAMRSAGFDNVDKEAAKELGIAVTNVTYSPNAISEFAITTCMSMYRNLPQMIKNALSHDHSLKGLMGREIRKSTVGIIGVGRIGVQTAKGFKGLGAKVLGYDIFLRDDLADILDYVSLEELYAQSDIIVLHMNLTADNYHMIDEVALAKMKKGAVLANVARGALVDAKAVLKALNSGHLGGFVMDTYEHENGILMYDCRFKNIDDEVFLALCASNRVLVTPHAAFYSDQAVSDMVEGAMKNAALFEAKKELANRVI